MLAKGAALLRDVLMQRISAAQKLQSWWRFSRDTLLLAISRSCNFSIDLNPAYVVLYIYTTNGRRLIMEIKPLERSKLAQSVSSYILNMVKNGELVPMQKIPTEMELAEAFHVSRNVVREGLKTLESLGILESKVAKGTFINANARENLVQYEFWEVLQKNAHIKDLVEVRLSLEPELAYYAARRHTEEDLKDMQRFLYNMSDLETWSSCDNCLEATYDFHLLIAKASKNEVMYKFLRMVYAQIKQGDAQKFSIEKKIYSNQIGHEKIYEAIECGDCKHAKKLMFDHIYPIYTFFCID